MLPLAQKFGLTYFFFNDLSLPANIFPRVRWLHFGVWTCRINVLLLINNHETKYCHKSDTASMLAQLTIRYALP